jgi:non-specific serine/threonine protein kinase
MLETVRAYAAEQLQSSGDLVQTRERALAYFTNLVKQAELGLRGAQQGSWLELLDREHDNLRGALGWCLEDGNVESGLGLAAGLGYFWELRGLYTEGRAWLTDLLALPATDQRTLARALALNTAGRLAASQGDDASVDALLTASMTIERELGEQSAYAGSLATNALLAHRRGDLVRARAMLEESLAIARELGDQWAIARLLQQLGDVAVDADRFAVARARYEESLLQSQMVGDAWGVASTLEGMAILAQTRADSARALQLIGAASAVRQRIDPTSSAPIQRLRVQESSSAGEAALGAERAAAAHAAGLAMSLDQAVTFARTIPEQAPTAPAATLIPAGPLAWLTRREQEVAALLLRGLSNRQIADELVITERTAETHVCRILSKLGLGSRAQIAAWVMDRSIIRDGVRAS